MGDDGSSEEGGWLSSWWLSHASLGLAIAHASLAVTAILVFELLRMSQQAHKTQPKETALARVRRLTAPTARQVYGGQHEHSDFWEEHKVLLNAAWIEYGRANKSVYTFGKHVLHASIADLSLSVKDGAARARALKGLMEEPCEGVYTFPLLSQSFCDALLDELDYLGASGIPLRRPNGMNRHGAILSHLGFGDLLKGLCEFCAPLACDVYKKWIGAEELEEQYGFTVRYQRGQDLSLAEHFDTSNLTLNICLGRDGFTGGDLFFKGVRCTESAKSDVVAGHVGHTPGWCVLHLGGHKHGASPIGQGERINLIIWCTGELGTVRIVPRIKKQKFLKLPGVDDDGENDKDGVLGGRSGEFYEKVAA